MIRNPNMSSKLGDKIKKSQKIEKLVKNIGKLSFILKFYFPSNTKIIVFSGGSLFFPHSQQLEVRRKMYFGRVPLKQHFGENGSKKRARFFYPWTLHIYVCNEDETIFTRIFENSSISLYAGTSVNLLLRDPQLIFALIGR